MQGADRVSEQSPKLSTTPLAQQDLLSKPLAAPLVPHPEPPVFHGLTKQTETAIDSRVQEWEVQYNINCTAIFIKLFLFVEHCLLGIGCLSHAKYTINIHITCSCSVPARSYQFFAVGSGKQQCALMPHRTCCIRPDSKPCHRRCWHHRYQKARCCKLSLIIAQEVAREEHKFKFIFLSLARSTGHGMFNWEMQD